MAAWIKRGRPWASGALPGLATVVVVAAGIYGLLELGKNDDWADTDSALAAAAWTLLGLTVLLYISGGGRRIAIAPFAVSDASAPAVTVKQGSPVPLGVERLPEVQGKIVEGLITTQRIVWWEGGADQQDIPAGTELDDGQAAQAPVHEQRNVTKEEVTYRDPAHVLHKDAGELVEDSLAGLPEFQGKTEGTGAARRAIVRVEFRDPARIATLAAGGPVPPALLTLPEFAGKVDQRSVALRPFVYFADAEKRTIEAGGLVPTDKERAVIASQGLTNPVPVATEDVTYNARRFAVNDPVPDDIRDPAVTVSIGLRHGLRLRRLVVGEDGRWSTSKLQVVLWTYVVVFILLTLLYFTELLQLPLTGEAGTDADKVKGVQFSELELPDAYYILLGGPFAAAILAKAFTQSKSESGTLVKTEATGALGPVQGLGQIISDDKGRTDILDLSVLRLQPPGAGLRGRRVHVGGQEGVPGGTGEPLRIDWRRGARVHDQEGRRPRRGQHHERQPATDPSRRRPRDLGTESSARCRQAAAG